MNWRLHPFLMEDTREENAMNTNWIAMEHYRLHVIETWADGPRKDVALAAIRSALEGLGRLMPDLSFECCVCGKA
jgi:hypothetical protein